MFSIENPKAFLFLIPLAAAIIFSVWRFIGLVNSLSKENDIQKSTWEFNRLQKSFVLRTTFRSLAALMMILAFAGISWGTNYIPVQKQGKAVSFVFDISYSMEARDEPDEMSRLEASSSYAKELMQRMKGTEISVVLDKGDGVVSVPLTEDFESVYNIVDNLSPKLMTSEGTSLGKGIKAAIKSFPEQSSEAFYIWVFTDGEETDDSLQSSLLEAAKNGIPVAIIGFGSERESEVFAGDGRTKVKTALRTASIQKTVNNVLKKTSSSYTNLKVPTVTYIDASEVGSAYKLLDMLQAQNDEITISYETKMIQRHYIFILLAILFMAASYFFCEFDTKNGKKRFLKKFGVSLMVCTMFTSCSVSAGQNILSGKMNWNKKDYQKATVNFIDAKITSENKENISDRDYALFGLGTTYLMEEEFESALNKYAEISEDAPSSIKFAVFYNSGIIAHRKGEYAKAAELFKQALLIDSTSTDAKINLELALQGKAVQAKQYESTLEAVNVSQDDKVLKNELYSLIRETEQTQWKNQATETESSSQDY